MILTMTGSPPTKEKARLQPGLGQIKYNHIKTNHSTNNILAEHYCCCRGGVTCIFCQTWKTEMHDIEAADLDQISPVLIKWHTNSRLPQKFSAQSQIGGE